MWLTGFGRQAEITSKQRKSEPTVPSNFKSAIDRALAPTATIIGRIPFWDEPLLTATLRSVYADALPIAAPRHPSHVLSTRAARLLAGTNVIVHRMAGFPDVMASGETILINAKKLETLLPEASDDEMKMLAVYHSRARIFLSDLLEAQCAFVTGDTTQEVGILPRMAPADFRAAVSKHVLADTGTTQDDADWVVGSIGVDDNETLARAKSRLTGLLSMDFESIEADFDQDVAMATLCRASDPDRQPITDQTEVTTGNALDVHKCLVDDPDLLDRSLTGAFQTRSALFEVCLGAITETSKGASVTIGARLRQSQQDGVSQLYKDFSKAAHSESYKNLHKIFAAFKESLWTSRGLQRGWETGRPSFEEPLTIILLAARLRAESAAANKDFDKTLMARSAVASASIPATRELIDAAGHHLPDFLSPSNPNLLKDLVNLKISPVWPTALLSDQFRAIINKACKDANRTLSASRSKSLSTSDDRFRDQAAGLRTLLEQMTFLNFSSRAYGFCSDSRNPKSAAAAAVFLSESSPHRSSDGCCLLDDVARVTVLYQKMADRDPGILDEIQQDQMPHFAADTIFIQKHVAGHQAPDNIMNILKKYPTKTYRLAAVRMRTEFPAMASMISSLAVFDIIRACATDTTPSGLANFTKEIDQERANFLQAMLETLSDEQIVAMGERSEELREAKGFKPFFERANLTTTAGLLTARPGMGSRVF